jgi:hypothetical protein
MRACNKEQLLPGSVIHALGHVFIVVFSCLLSGVTACSSPNSRLQPPPLFLFDKRPYQMNCADRPTLFPPGAKGRVISPVAPYARTRLDTLNLPISRVPALAIAAEPHNFIKIASASQDHWTIQFCAMGEGNTAEEASRYLNNIPPIQQTGSLLTFGNTDSHGQTGGKGTMLLQAPAEAPLTVHSSGAVEVHDMAGPVRITAKRGRATILNTSGLVDASAMIIDFAGSQGTVTLDASWDINLKLTAVQFRGNLIANAQRQVGVLFPPGSQTSLDVFVNRTKDFICRADFCSKVKKGRENSWYRFSYGDVANAPDRIRLSSENAEVTLDTTHENLPAPLVK